MFLHVTTIIPHQTHPESSTYLTYLSQASLGVHLHFHIPLTHSTFAKEIREKQKIQSTFGSSPPADTLR